MCNVTTRRSVLHSNAPHGLRTAKPVAVVKFKCVTQNAASNFYCVVGLGDLEESSVNFGPWVNACLDNGASEDDARTH